MARQSTIKKSATATVKAAEGVHELTSIKVHEVSAVDRAANRRKFLVTKADSTEGETAAEISARVQAKIAARAGNTPGADLDAADAAKAAPAVETVVAETPATPPVVAPVAAAKVDAAPIPPAPGAIVAPNEGIDALVKSIEIEASPQLDGSISISVVETATPPGPAPVAVQDCVKVAVMAAIDAVVERLNKLRSDVGASQGTWSDSGVPQELYGLWYIRDMIAAIYDIGGPQWEIEMAVDMAMDSVNHAATAEPTAKAAPHRAITVAKMGKLTAAHRALSFVTKDMGQILRDLKKDASPATVAAATAVADALEGASDLAKAAVAAAAASTPPAAPVAIDIFSDPRFVAMQEANTRNEALVGKLQKMVTDQSAIIEKARNSVASSNANPENGTRKSASSDKVVVWENDLAAEKTKPTRKF